MPREGGESGAVGGNVAVEWTVDHANVYCSEHVHTVIM